MPPTVSRTARPSRGMRCLSFHGDHTMASAAPSSNV